MSDHMAMYSPTLAKMIRLENALAAERKCSSALEELLNQCQDTLEQCREAFLALPDGWGEAMPATLTPLLLKLKGN